ncbi:HDOD domain-containing protein [Dasania marina]|uniref:HDOD domain-containing protein n=1 Tax=Dasania marina TaxID=471499 RepID=UPI000377CDBD|nr:HDOD domain-containing protein [Dasania marina]
MHEQSPLSTPKTINQLPSLPQVLIKILDAIHGEAADFQQLADIIRQDPAVASKLIQVASSSYYGRSQNCSTIERALMLLGTDTVKTIIITTAIKHFFNHFSQQHTQFLKQFWRRSLITANFAQALATLTRYSAPEEAYLCGLLTDVGQLILLTEFNEDYLQVVNLSPPDYRLLEEEQKHFHYNHCNVAADLIDSWNISTFMGDAVRYHHEELEQIQDAQHLVKIIYLSSLLGNSSDINDNSLTASHELFGLNEALTREIHGRILSDVENMAGSLNIDLSEQLHTEQQAHQDLAKRLGELSELSQLNQTLWQVQSHEALEQTIGRALLLTFGIQQCVLLEYQTEQNRLVGLNDGESSPAFNIAVQAGRSLSSEALLNQSIQHSVTSTAKLSVIDKQLIRLCLAEHILCLPLIHGEQTLGVLVLGINPKQLPALQQRFGQLLSLGQEIAASLHRLNATNATINDDTQQQKLQNNILEVIHEASNPLSIIRNYLELLRVDLGSQHSANNNLNLIKDEIDRVGKILLRLKDPSDNNDDSITDINKIISDTAQIFINSSCVSKQIDLKLHLDQTLQPAKVNSAYLKQILTNLIKNACEALSSGQQITLRSNANVDSNGRSYISIIISDNGPGIPTEVKEQLFLPQQSTKGSKHSGLGLSIVKKLVDEMDGIISCRSQQPATDSESSGTEFHLLLPK